MSLFRTAIVLGAIVMLLPTDEPRKAQVANVAGQAMERALTFCERNPATCTAGRELWATFVQKAQFGVELASNMVGDYMARDTARPDNASRGREVAADARQQGQQQPTVAARPVGQNVRIEPVGVRGTLARQDLEPQWRGVPAR